MQPSFPAYLAWGVLVLILFLDLVFWTSFHPLPQRLQKLGLHPTFYKRISPRTVRSLGEYLGLAHGLAIAGYLTGFILNLLSSAPIEATLACLASPAITGAILCPLVNKYS